MPDTDEAVIRRQNLMDGLGEELRVLYVAMTRAKEKLILTGMASEKLIAAGRKGERLLFSDLMGAECPLAWILPALNPEEQESSVKISIVSMKQVIREAIREQMAEQLSRDELERRLLYGMRDQESEDRIESLLNWTYAWKDRDSRQTEIYCYGAEKTAAAGRDGIWGRTVSGRGDCASGTAVY